MSVRPNIDASVNRLHCRKEGVRAGRRFLPVDTVVVEAVVCVAPPLGGLKELRGQIG